MLEIFKLTFNDKIDKTTHPEIETDVADYNLVLLNLPHKQERSPQPSALPSALSLLQIETSVEVKQRFPAAEMFSRHLA